MIVVAERTGGIESDGIKREALNMFGGKRMTERSVCGLGKALSAALKREVLRQNGSGMITSCSQ